MPRLIDAEKLAEYKASGVSELTEWQKGWNDAIDTIMGETPTVDAEPVKRGRWIRDPDLNGWYHCFYRCSVCATRYPGLVDYIPYLYCPNCGAKMDSERRDVTK